MRLIKPKKPEELTAISVVEMMRDEILKTQDEILDQVLKAFGFSKKALEKALDELCQYERTGLTPEEVIEVAQRPYVGAEKILEEIEAERADVNESVSATGRMLDRHWNNCLNVVIEIVKNHANDEWIPADKDNIPGKEVLVCDKRGNEALGYLGYDPECDEFFCEGDGVIMYQAVAWREKPYPYHQERSQP